VVGWFRGGRGGFIHIKDMYHNDVGKKGARVYEAYETKIVFLLCEYMGPNRHGFQVYTGYPTFCVGLKKPLACARTPKLLPPSKLSTSVSEL